MGKSWNALPQYIRKLALPRSVPLAARPSAWMRSEFISASSVEREDAFEVVRVPGRYPLPAERGKVGRCVVLALHGSSIRSRSAREGPMGKLGQEYLPIWT